MSKQIGVEHTKNVIVFDPLVTSHVIRRMSSGRVRIFNGNQWETLSRITQERIGVGASNLVGIVDVRVNACGILSRWQVKQTGSRNMADIRHIKCKNQQKTSPSRTNVAL